MSTILTPSVAHRCSGSIKAYITHKQYIMPKQSKQRKNRVTVIARRKPAKSELTRLGSALRALGGLGGGALGGLIGMPAAGSNFGTGLGASISKWLGSGDYEVTQNSVVSNAQRMSSTVPDMHKSNQSIIVRHKEFVTTVNSSQNFQVQASLEINPGNTQLFPWLAGVATRFQEYKIRGMVYHYVPTSGSAVASTNAALGAVMLQTSYRASDTPPDNKLEMLNEYNSNESVPCEAFCHPIECDPKENPFNIQYVRSVATSAAEDKLLYDLGTTHLAVQGCQTTGNPIGDLWVTYEIELKKPIVSSNITTPFATYGATVLGASTASYFSGSVTKTGTLPLSLSGRTITFPKGRVGSYQVTVWHDCTANQVTFTGAPIVTNCSLLTGPGGSSFWAIQDSGTVDVQTASSYTTWVQLTDPSVEATITLPALILTGSFTYSSTRLTVSLYTPFA